MKRSRAEALAPIETRTLDLIAVHLPRPLAQLVESYIWPDRWRSLGFAAARVGHFEPCLYGKRHDAIHGAIIGDHPEIVRAMPMSVDYASFYVEKAFDRNRLEIARVLIERYPGIVRQYHFGIACKDSDEMRMRAYAPLYGPMCSHCGRAKVDHFT